MKQKFLLKTMLLLCALVVGTSSSWADTYEQLTSIENIDESAEYVLGIDGTGFHYEGTSSWGKCALPSAQTPIKYTLKKASDGKSFTAEATISSTKYYLQVPTSNTFSMATSTGTNTDLIIGTTQVSETNYAVANKSTTTRHLRINGTSGLRSYAGTTGTMAFFYKVVGKTDPTITFTAGSVNVGKNLDLSTLFTSNSSGAVTYSITAGGSYASITGSILTGVAEGSVTVKASQAATNDYNAGEESTTITVNAALVLSNIAITTAPTTTTYKEGQTFDPTGMVITATYSDLSTDDVTSYCSFTPSGALSASDTKVTVSYTENEVTKTAEQAITVNAQSTDITINTNYEWLGVENTKNIPAADLPKAIDCDGLTVTLGDGGTTKPRGDSDFIRVYGDNSFTFTAPANHFIKEIVFTANGSNWGKSFDADKGSYNNNTKTWTCGTDLVNEVTLTVESGSGNSQIKKIEVTLVASKDITITAATWASFSCDKALDFTGTGVTAYIAKVKDDSNVTLTEITKVPANTGIVVNASAGTYAIPVLSGDADDTTGNLLKPWLTAGEPTETTYYTLAVSGGEPVFYTSTGGVLAANKAYLVMPGNSTAPSLGVFFGGTTGVNDVRSKTEEVRGEYFNLAGQRVAQPTKGLYIVNGKKVIIK